MAQCNKALLPVSDPAGESRRLLYLAYFCCIFLVFSSLNRRDAANADVR